MRDVHFDAATHASKHSRENSKLQNLSARRNWSTGVIIGGMMGGLRYLTRIWPGLDTQRAVWALQQIEIDIDMQWYDKRDELRLQLAEGSINGNAAVAGPYGEQQQFEHREGEYSPRSSYR